MDGADGSGDTNSGKQRRLDLLERHIGLLVHEVEQKGSMGLERRPARLVDHRRNAARRFPLLRPPDRGRGADIELARRFAPRQPALDCLDDPLPKVFGIGSHQTSPNQMRSQTRPSSARKESSKFQIDSIEMENALRATCKIICKICARRGNIYSESMKIRETACHAAILGFVLVT